jgi:hypothetical protein
MHPLTIIFYLVCGIAALVAFIKSKEKEKVEAIKSSEDLTKKAKELEKVKVMYFQFKDYLEGIFACGPCKGEELEKKLKKDFSYYKSESISTQPLFWDLLYTNIISTSSHSSDLYYKGRAFTDIRLNFPNFLEFLETDQFGRHYQKTGFIDQDFADEVITERMLSLEPKRRPGEKLYKRYFFSISKGKKLNYWERNASFDLDDNQLYLMCEFRVIEYDYRVKDRQVILLEPIHRDLAVTGYRKLFDQTFEKFQNYNPSI